MRLALVVNAESGTATDPERLASLLGADGAAVAVVPIAGVPPSGELPAEARDADRIVVAGGDGSIGLAAAAAARAGVPLAVVATGTANDFARALELPREVERACALARDPGAPTRHCELGRVGERPFVNAASVGLSVLAAHHAHPYKSRLGPLAYAVGAVRAGLTARPLRCRVTCDGEERFDGEAWQVIVAATGAFGGGSQIGGTTAHDGELDAAVVPAGPRVALVRRAFGMRRGRLTAQDPVAHHRGRHVEVDVTPAQRFNVDGEVCRCEPARFELVPGGFELVVGA